MAVVAIAIGAYLLVPPLCAGALLFDGGVEVEPPAPAGAGLLDDGLTTGVLAGVGLFGMLDPTPVVCGFGCRVLAALAALSLLPCGWRCIGAGRWFCALGAGVLCLLLLDDGRAFWVVRCAWAAAATARPTASATRALAVCFIRESCAGL